MSIEKRFNRLRLVVTFILIVAGWEAGAAQRKQSRLPHVDTVSTAQLQQMIQQNKGGVTLVNVWATWCDPCKKEIPSLVKLRHEFDSTGFKLILVSADDIELAETNVPRTLRKLSVNFQTYIKQDTTDEAFMMGMNPDWSGALPTSFLYDKEGKLADMMVGERSYVKFKVAVKKLMSR